MGPVPASIQERLQNLTDYVKPILGADAAQPSYLDLEYAWWQVWLLWPVIALMVIPLSLLIALFLSAFFVECYRHWHGLRAAYELSIWDGARYTVCVCWKVHGRIWHGYEVSGMENIPAGPAIIVFYHGAIPIDHYYLLSEVLTRSGRLIKTVGDRFLYSIPGWKQLMSVFCVIPGGQANCVSSLQQGNLLAISPGGVREAFFGQGYRLVWKDRVGFAKVAVEAKVTCFSSVLPNSSEAEVLQQLKTHRAHVYHERARVVPVVRGRPPFLDVAVRAHPAAAGAHLRRLPGQDEDLPGPADSPRGRHHARAAGAEGLHGDQPADRGAPEAAGKHPSRRHGARHRVAQVEGLVAPVVPPPAPRPRARDDQETTGPGAGFDLSRLR